MSKRIEWTAEMDERLVCLNRRAHEVTLRQIAEEMDVSIGVVHRRIKRLAASGAIPSYEAKRYHPREKKALARPRKWTPEKLQQLIDLFDGMRSDEQIGELMGETSEAIRGQVWLLRKAGRLPKGRRYYGLKPRADRAVSRIFSQRQDRLLITHVQEGKTWARIAKKLGMTERQVRTRVAQLRQCGQLPPYNASKRASQARLRQQLVIWMYRDGRSLKDIATACESTPGAISVMLVRLRKKGEVRMRPHPRELKRDRATSNSATTGSGA